MTKLNPVVSIVGQKTLTSAGTTKRSGLPLRPWNGERGLGRGGASLSIADHGPATCGSWSDRCITHEPFTNNGTYPIAVPSPIGWERVRVRARSTPKCWRTSSPSAHAVHAVHVVHTVHCRPQGRSSTFIMTHYSNRPPAAQLRRSDISVVNTGAKISSPVGVIYSVRAVGQ